LENDIPTGCAAHLIEVSLHAQGRHTVDAEDLIAGLKSCLGGWGSRGDFIDDQLVTWTDTDPSLTFFSDEHGIDRKVHHLTITLDREYCLALTVGRFAGAQSNRVLDIHPVLDLRSVNLPDDITDLESRFRSGTGDFSPVNQLEGRTDVSKPSGGCVAAFWLTNEPENAREQKRKEDVEHRACHENEHSRGIANRGKPFYINVALALDCAEIGELGQEHVASERNPRHAVFDAVFSAPGKNRRAETDRETLNVNPATARSEEVAELVHKDRAAKAQNH
jgi:hypothetical protein